MRVVTLIISMTIKYGSTCQSAELSPAIMTAVKPMQFINRAGNSITGLFSNKTYPNECVSDAKKHPTRVGNCICDSKINKEN